MTQGRKRKTDMKMSAALKREHAVKKRMAHLESLVKQASECGMSYGKYVEKLIKEGKYFA